MNAIPSRERKLASIQRIAKLEPIPGADAIEKARVLSWDVVVKRGEFSEGDLCVYCEIDSQMPEREEFAFLRTAGFRIRTVRLRGQVSQGICFPLSILSTGVAPSLSEGADVTEMLGVTKFERPIPTDLAGEVIGAFPGWIPKTDEVRIQATENIVVDGEVTNGVLHRHRGARVIATEKLDGSSATFFLGGERFGVCSRNLELAESERNTFWRIARSLQIEERLRESGRLLALQGELIGPGVQGNIYRLSDHQVRFFNAYDLCENRFLGAAECRSLVESFGLANVPLIGEFDLDHTVDDLIVLAEGKSSLCPAQRREGIVVRSVGERFDPEIGRLSFKVISPTYLLKEGE